MGNNNCLESFKKQRDPITLADIEDHKFVFSRKVPGAKEINVEYNVSSLVDYFLSSGDFWEPETRLELTDQDLVTLDLQVKRAGLERPSVLEAKRNSDYFREQKWQREVLTGLERLTGDIVSDMLMVIEKMNSEEGQLKLVMSLFPAFEDYHSQMEKVDLEYSRQCLLHYKTYLKGPPNKPTVDKNGLLKVVLQFLDNFSKSEEFPQGSRW